MQIVHVVQHRRRGLVGAQSGVSSRVVQIDQDVQTCFPVEGLLILADRLARFLPMCKQHAVRFERLFAEELLGVLGVSNDRFVLLKHMLSLKPRPV